ncbi:MAG: hypothetical protein FWD73_14765 [Polyangiaceae bacterium]|nr:hypothetical protein [Polyangiaceae bacterium]
MSTQESPYREEDAEARAQLDAELREARARLEAKLREELAEQARLRKLSRHALDNENAVENDNEPRRQFRWDIAIGTGAIAGAALGGVGWWATDDLSVLVVAPIVGVIFGVFFAGLWNKPGKFSDAPPEESGAGAHI